MSNVAVLPLKRAVAPMPVDYLGAAEVILALPHELSARLPDGAVVRARLALAFPYEPQEGDEILVIGRGREHYVIGVLRGAGRTTLALEGDVELRARGGVLRLSSDQAVEVAAPEVKMTAGKLQVLAGAVAQTFASLRQTVTELLSVRAGQSHTVVAGSSFAQSKRATVLSEEKMTLNGKEIYLG